jgi:16S rRNA (guanine527-N7)-methyltransferase
MSEPSPGVLPTHLQGGLRDLALDLPAAAVDRLLQYLTLIGQWNRVYNLTAVREPEAMLRQHLLDCLAIIGPLRRALPAGAPRRLLDVGSGAGLPGVVLAICEPAWQVTCVDTVAKKASFIRQVAAELGLPNLQAVHQRVEDMPADARFDLVTSRAFATLADFVALTSERLSPGGAWVAMKAHLSGDERRGVPPGVEVFHVEPLAVPGLDATRCLVWMRPA